MSSGVVVECKECGKELASADALKMHVDAKHSVEPAAPRFSISVSRKAKYLVVAFVVIAGFLGLATFASSSQASSFPPALSPEPMHIHSKLSIYVDGVSYPIPKNVGIGLKHQPLHTHEEGDGTIHVESEDTRAYTLGDFFRVWGNRLTSTCLFDYCTGNGKVLSMKVNSGPSSEFENHVLRDGETIELRFE